jgi:hypothetical protein
MIKWECICKRVILDFEKDDQEWYGPVEQEQHDQVIMTIRDFQGQLIRLTQRQWSHILDHHDHMNGQERAVEATLENPEEVRKSREDPNTVRLYYRRYTNPGERNKWVCVLVKFLENDAFILTAYETRKVKSGELI